MPGKNAIVTITAEVKIHGSSARDIHDRVEQLQMAVDNSLNSIKGAWFDDFDSSVSFEMQDRPKRGVPPENSVVTPS